MAKYLSSLPIILLVFVSSCNNKDESAVVKEMQNSLSFSAKAIFSNSEDIRMSFQQMIVDPKTKSKADVFYPAVIAIQEKSNTTINYITRLLESLNGNSRNIFFEDKAFKDSLFLSFKNLISYLFDSSRRHSVAFRTPPILFDTNFVENLSGKESFERNYQTGISASNLKTRLLVWQNNIRMAEYRTLRFLFEQINTEVGCGFGKKRLESLVYMSSEVVKKGTSIKIEAGLVSFDLEINPKISIDGKRVPQNYGMASYEINKKRKEGKYKVPVEISFIDPNTGEILKMTKTLEYEVVK